MAKRKFINLQEKATFVFKRSYVTYQVYDLKLYENTPNQELIVGR